MFLYLTEANHQYNKLHLCQSFISLIVWCIELKVANWVLNPDAYFQMYWKKSKSIGQFANEVSIRNKFILIIVLRLWRRSRCLAIASKWTAYSKAGCRTIRQRLRMLHESTVPVVHFQPIDLFSAGENPRRISKCRVLTQRKCAALAWISKRQNTRYRLPSQCRRRLKMPSSLTHGHLQHHFMIYQRQIHRHCCEIIILKEK